MTEEYDFSVSDDDRKQLEFGKQQAALGNLRPVPDKPSAEEILAKQQPRCPNCVRAEQALREMTKDRDLWQGEHNEDCPNLQALRDEKTAHAETAKVWKYGCSERAKLQMDYDALEAERDSLREEVERLQNCLTDANAALMDNESCGDHDAQ